MSDTEVVPPDLASAPDVEAPTVTLGPEFTIAQAAEQHPVLLDAVARVACGALRVDLSKVSDFDSAGIQLLLATQRSLREKGADMHITASSAVVLDALRCYGLETHFRPAEAADAGTATIPSQEDQPCQ